MMGPDYYQVVCPVRHLPWKVYSRSWSENRSAVRGMRTLYARITVNQGFAPWRELYGGAFTKGTWGMCVFWFRMMEEE